MMYRTGIIAAYSLLVAACGFTPLYEERGEDFQSALSGISLQPIPEPAGVGFQLQNEMSERIGVSNGAKYDLTVSLSERRQAIGITSTDRTTRYNYTLLANYTLTDLASGEKFSNQKFVVTSYGLVESHYASLVGEEDAIRKAVIDMADKIELDMVLYFKRGFLSPAETPVENQFEDLTR